jgi:hypothetical protein
MVRNKIAEILQLYRVISSGNPLFLPLFPFIGPPGSPTIHDKTVYKINGSIGRMVLPHHPRTPCYFYCIILKRKDLM